MHFSVPVSFSVPTVSKSLTVRKIAQLTYAWLFVAAEKLPNVHHIVESSTRLISFRAPLEIKKSRGSCGFDLAGFEF